MRAPLLLAVVLAGCGSPQPSEATPSATPPERAAIDLLECDAAPDDLGGEGEGIAIEGGGPTPEAALLAFLDDTPFTIPREGYALIARSGDRFAFGYLNGDEVKVVVVVSPRFGEMMRAAFTPDELRACPLAEFGAEATFGEGTRVWVNEDSGAILTDIEGPRHCDWQSARMLHVETDDGVKQYVRDPEGVIGGAQFLATYADDVALPDDATDSGYRSPEGFELWFTAADEAAYVVTPDAVERWPRPADPVGCF
jgi:hypothetical protein